MSSGSYRGGSSLMGWNANGYASGANRPLSRKARLKMLTTKTAQTRSESAASDEAARRRHGLGPSQPPPVKWAPKLDAEFAPNADFNARQRRLSRTSAPLVVVKVKKRGAPAKTPKRQVSAPAGKGRKG
jgi:hypothetical protein